MRQDQKILFDKFKIDIKEFSEWFTKHLSKVLYYIMIVVIYILMKFACLIWDFSVWVEKKSKETKIDENKNNRDK